MRHIRIISLLLFTYTLSAQNNLIRNPGLESWKGFPPIDWRIISYSVDFFRSDMRMFSQESPGDYKFRSNFPIKGHDGLSYLGLDRREIVQGALSEPLIKGKEYLISCWVYKPDIYTKNVLDKFTIRFSADSMKLQTNNLKVNDGYELVKMDGKAIKDQEWQLISNSFIAKGNEKYFQLGFFNGLVNGAFIVYYLFDDFSLTEVKHFLTERTFYYNSNIDTLLNDQKEDIKQLVSSVIKIDSVVISGYADDLGDGKSNLALSSRRCSDLETIIKKYTNNINCSLFPKGDTESKGKNRRDFRKVELKVYHKGKIPLQEITPQFDSSLMLTLKNLQYQDQYFRIIEDSLIRCCNKTNPELLKANDRKMVIQDSIILIKIKEIIQIYGYPGLSKVSPDYMNTVVLILLHSDLKTQELYVDLIKQEIDKGEIGYEWYPYLIDKIQIGKKQEQEYGTQCGLDEKINQFILSPTRDLKTLDNRRRQYGLPPVNEYLKSMNKGLKQKR